MMVNKFRVFLICFFIFLVVGGFFWVRHYLHQPTTFPIRMVKVVGEYQFIDPETLEKVVTPYVSTGFFNVDIQDAELALSEIPGVESANLKRVWPDKIEIRIVEKKAEATLPHGEIYATDGTIFKPIISKDLGSFPIFAGSMEDLPAMTSFYHSAEFLLMKEGFHVTFVGCDGLGSWTIGVIHGGDNQNPSANMTIILGQDHLIEKLTRFTEHYSMLEQTNGGRVPSSVDLRYTLGFSAKYSQKVA